MRMKKALLIAVPLIVTIIAAPPPAEAGGSDSVSVGLSYIFPSASRDAQGMNLSLRYCHLFIADLGISASVASAFPINGPKNLDPLLTAELGVYYMIDLGPVSPYINAGGDYYNGALGRGRGSHLGVFAAVGIEIALPKGFALGIEYGYRALIETTGFYTAYQGLGLIFLYEWGTASKSISKI